jgi:hypothetical protein
VYGGGRSRTCILPPGFLVTHPTLPSPSAIGDLARSTDRGALFTPTSSPSAALQQLVGETVETVLQALWDGGLLVPTVLSIPRDTRTEARSLEVFGDPTSIDTDMSRSLQLARRHVDTITARTSLRYVWAFDGFVGPQRSEAVVIEAAEAHEPHGWRLAVRYRFSKRGIALLDDDAVVTGAVRLPFCDGLASYPEQ